VARFVADIAASQRDTMIGRASHRAAFTARTHDFGRFSFRDIRDSERAVFWRRSGRPRVPPKLRQLIKDIALANRTWGEERIAAELLLKLGIRVSPRTARRYMPAAVPPTLEVARSPGARS
jgi:hypothetical protein